MVFKTVFINGLVPKYLTSKFESYYAVSDSVNKLSVGSEWYNPLEQLQGRVQD